MLQGKPPNHLIPTPLSTLSLGLPKRNSAWLPDANQPKSTFFPSGFQRLSTSGMWANATLPGLLELSVTCKEQASPDYGSKARGRGREGKARTRAGTGCDLEQGCRKRANTKPRACLRNNACVWERSGFLLLHPHVIQELWLLPLPRADSPAHHTSPTACSGSATAPVTLKPLLTGASGCELY